ncbi:MAG: hypothetical protein ACI8PZ_005810 [Myxococcota bacterium]|jgi:hypothetical protein
MFRACFVLAAVGVAATATAQTLDMSGVCPGPVDIMVSGLTPGGTAVFLFGAVGEGSDVIGVGRCTGTATGLAGIRFATRVTADGAGNAAFSPTFPDGRCDTPVQVLDASSCAVSNVDTAAGGVEPGVMRWEDVTTGSCPGDIGVRFGEIAAAMPAEPTNVTITAHQVAPLADYGHWSATFVDTTCVRTWLETIAARDVSTYDSWDPAVCNATTDTGESYFFVCKNDGGGNPQIAIYPTDAPAADFMKLYMLDRTFAWCDLAGVDNRLGFDAEVTNSDTFGNAGDYVEFAW